MMTALKRLLLGGAALAMCSGVTPRADAQTGSAELPPDIATFVSRRASCSQWSKKAIDPERRAQIEAIYSNLHSMKCFGLIDEDRALRLKYASNPEILALLGEGKFTKFVTRLSPRIAVPPASDR
jgi:hypothetical protein